MYIHTTVRFYYGSLWFSPQTLVGIGVKSAIATLSMFICYGSR